MAQLHDTVVSGSLRATDTIYSTTNQFQILRIPTASNGTTYGPGTNGQILKSNGTSVYWASDNNSDTKVTQAAAITTAGAYPIILANSTATTAVTDTVNKTSTLTYNPNTKSLVTGGTVDGYALAAASAKAVTDSSSASAIGTGTSLPTERDIYYGLPTINNAHNYTSSTSIYAPTSAGTANQLLVSAGGTFAPTWRTLVATDIPDISGTYLKLSGGTMTGILTLKANQYTGPSGNYGLNANNSDIINVNGIFTKDLADNFGEGYMFYRDATHWDGMAAKSGVFYFGSNLNAYSATLIGNAEIRCGHIISRNNDVTINTSANNGNTGSSPIYHGLSIRDSANNIYGEVLSAVDTNGRIRLYINAKNKKTDGTEVTNPFGVGVEKDGTAFYRIGDPEVFRDTLGASSGIWPISLGGTGATSFTANSVVISGNTTTAALTTTGAGTAGQYLISNGENNPPSWEKLEIGGRNLLTGTETMKTFNKGSRVSIANGVATLTGSTADWNARLDSSKYDIGLYDGETTYIWSFEYACAADFRAALIIASTAGSVEDAEWNRTMYTSWENLGTVDLPATGGKWVKFTTSPRTIAQFDLTSGTGDMVSGYLTVYGRTDDGVLNLRHFKLEKGSKATDWTPAPEDFIETTNGIYYGVCDTAQATQAKEATLVNGSNFSLKEGAIIAIKFTYASAAATMTLDVNGTGAKNLYLYGTSVMSSTVATNGWQAGAIVIFIYNGTSWIRQYWANTTYTLTSVWSNTAAATAAKVSSNSSYFTIKDGTYFDFTLRYSNTVQSALTLNINSTGAKSIYINGEPSSNTNYELPGGKYLVYYNDDKYYFINPEKQNAPDPIIGPVTGNGAITGPQALNKLGIIYSSTAPSDPIEGMIWLQPI